MPSIRDFQVGDRVIYQRPHPHERNGEIGNIAEVHRDDYLVVFDRVISGRRDRICNPRNLHDAATFQFTKAHANESVMDVIQRLHRRQHFFRTIGKDLPAWSNLTGAT